MANLFVFGIGGTGERVMRSFVMLMAAGIPSLKGWNVYPVIIDYDKANGDKSRVGTLLQTYNDVNRAAYSRYSDPQKDGFFEAPLKALVGLQNYVLQYNVQLNQNKFCNYIGYNNLSGGNIMTKYLLNTLYDDCNDANSFMELNLDMTVGFKGNPNIGSVVFHKLEETVAFKDFVGKCGDNDKIVIVGSLFGGTGASGIPELINAIHTKLPKNEVATLLMLPYFAPNNVNGGVIDSSRFNAKTKAAIKYYQDSGLTEKVSKIYYLGDPKPTKIPYCDGGSDQKNNANMVELLAAMAIDHFLASQTNNKEYKFSLDDIKLANSKFNILDLNCLYVEYFDNYSKTQIFKYTKALALALKYHHDEICEDKVGEKVSYMDLLGLSHFDDKKNVQQSLDPQYLNLQHLCAHMYKFYDEYKSWLAELNFEGDNELKTDPNSHRLALYDMTKDYKDIVLTEPKQVGNTSNFFKIGKKNKGKKIDVKDSISAEMNKNYVSYSGTDEVNNKVAFEFQFMDILRNAVMEVSSKI